MDRDASGRELLQVTNTNPRRTSHLHRRQRPGTDEPLNRAPGDPQRLRRLVQRQQKATSSRYGARLDRGTDHLGALAELRSEALHRRPSDHAVTGQVRHMPLQRHAQRRDELRSQPHQQELATRTIRLERATMGACHLCHPLGNHAGGSSSVRQQRPVALKVDLAPPSGLGGRRGRARGRPVRLSEIHWPLPPSTDSSGSVEATVDNARRERSRAAGPHAPRASAWSPFRLPEMPAPLPSTIGGLGKTVANRRRASAGSPMRRCRDSPHPWGSPLETREALRRGRGLPLPLRSVWR